MHNARKVTVPLLRAALCLLCVLCCVLWYRCDVFHEHERVRLRACNRTLACLCTRNTLLLQPVRTVQPARAL